MNHLVSFYKTDRILEGKGGGEGDFFIFYFGISAHLYKNGKISGWCDVSICHFLIPNFYDCNVGKT